MPGKADGSEPVTVILPPEPPRLTPGAARALLQILVKALSVSEVVCTDVRSPLHAVLLSDLLRDRGRSGFLRPSPS